MSYQNSSHRLPLWRQLYNQEDDLGKLLKAITESILDELGLTTNYYGLDDWRVYDKDPAKFQLNFSQQLDQKLGIERGDIDAFRKALATRVETYLKQHEIEAGGEEKQQQLSEGLFAEFAGFGPLEPLLLDEEITDIIVHGPSRVYFRRGGKFEQASLSFWSSEHLMWIMDRIFAPMGLRLSEDEPMLTTRLPDGARVSAAVPPVSLVGPALAIQTFRGERYTIDRLVEMEALTKEMAEFLSACIDSKLNILLCGNVGSDVVQWTNAIADLIPDDDLIVTVETIATLSIRKKHVLTLEASMDATADRIGASKLLDMAARFMPERIIIGNVSGHEVFPALHLMSGGQNGVILTTFANDRREALARLEVLSLLSRPDLPLHAIRFLIANSIDIVMVVSRLEDGSQIIMSITDVVSMEGDSVVFSDIFTFVRTGQEGSGVQGSFGFVGLRPELLNRIHAAGVKIDPALWEQA